MKKVESIFSNSDDMKPIVMMSKHDVEEALTSETVRQLKQLFLNDGMLHERVEDLGLEERSQVCYQINCLLNDLSSCCKTVLRLRKMLMQLNKLVDGLEPDQMFQAVGEQIASLVECEKGEVYLLDERN